MEEGGGGAGRGGGPEYFSTSCKKGGRHRLLLDFWDSEYSAYIFANSHPEKSKRKRSYECLSPLK